MSLQLLKKFNFLNRPKALVGIDIGSQAIKVVHLKKSGDRWTLLKWSVIPYSDENGPDAGLGERRDHVVSALQNYLKTAAFPSKKTATSISGNFVIVRYVKMAKMMKSDLAKSLKFEAEPYIPFNIDEVSLGFHVIGDVVEDGQVQMDTVIVAAKRDAVDLRVDILKSAGMIPAVLDVDAFAIENAYQASNPLAASDTAMFVNIGANFTNMSIVEKGVSRVVRDVSIAGHTFSKALQNQLQCDFHTAEQKKIAYGLDESPDNPETSAISEVLLPVARDLITEIQRSMDFYLSQGADRNISKIYLCGGSASLKKLDQLISNELKLPVEIFDPIANLLNAPLDLTEEQKALMPQLAVAVGLATRQEQDHTE